jgi:60 kDa SS-A/Ro ribonucleoprotein
VATDPLATISTRTTPQSQPADARQELNNAGGYTFAVGDDVRLHRFLTLGVAGGTYYTAAPELARENAEVVLAAARSDATHLVEQIVAVSTAGRAPRANPALFALAAAASLGDERGRRAALDALPVVARTGTQLFTFVGYAEQFRGWGRGLARAVAGWYTGRSVDDTAYQVLKYRQRNGWSNRDLLRLSHPRTLDPARRVLFSWITKGGDVDGAPTLISAFMAAQAATTPKAWVRLIEEHPLSWEMLPDAALTEPEVWQALVERGMPQTALMRQLGRLTTLGVLTQSSKATSTVVAQLANPDRLRKARVHPVNILVALKTYASGEGFRGHGSWTPVRQVIDALDAAFYAAFGFVEPAGKRTLLALDVSGSMTSPAGDLPVSCREVSAALAMVTMASEPDTTVVGFCSAAAPSRSTYGYGTWGRDGELTELAISPRQRLDDAVRSISNLPFGGTDCSLPMTWAGERGLTFDTIQIYTDNETWAGGIHPHQALAQYRQKTGVDTRLAVVALTPTRFSIADPDDAGMMDVSGFDSTVPNLLADFSRGDV